MMGIFFDTQTHTHTKKNKSIGSEKLGEKSENIHTENRKFI